MFERGCSIVLGAVLMIGAVVLTYYAIMILNTEEMTPGPITLETLAPMVWILAIAAVGILLVLYGRRRDKS
jgi:hypothetical protein